MSLATRCTSCGTVFRVVQDQLKVSDGWVRCGRCDAVFNAGEALFDLEREVPPPWSPPEPPVEAPAVPVEPVSRPGAAPQDREALPPHDGEPAARAAADAAPRSDVGADWVAIALARHAEEAAASAGAAQPVGAAPDPEPVETPSTLAWRTDAERPRGGRRATVWLAGAAVLLAIGLAAQATGQFSEVAAARWPGLRPALARWCSVAGCSLAAPRRIEDIVVDSSALAPVIGTDALKLGISLRNRANFAVAVPSVDLSLTDSAGRLLARRLLHPADFRVAVNALAAGAELPLQAMITAGTAPVTGYTVEIFYP